VPQEPEKLARFDGHFDTVLWAQCYQRLGDYRESFFQVEAKFLGDCSDYQRGFQLSEALPDAAARAVAEWEVGARGQVLF